MTGIASIDEFNDVFFKHNIKIAYAHHNAKLEKKITESIKLLLFMTLINLNHIFIIEIIHFM